MTESREGSTFGRYRLDKLLGRGGMGEVYEAYDTEKDRVIALKLLNPELSGSPDYEERFRRECRAAARLREPHVIPIHDFGTIDGTLYLDMRLVRGQNLKQILRGGGRFPVERALLVAKQVAAALDAAHADGLVHRDVKPENILLQDDFAYLVDFGVAYAQGDPQLTIVGTAVGSYAYMAPERLDDKPVTPSGDVYSLACVMYEMLVGTPPFNASSITSAIRAHLLETPSPVSASVSGLPSGIDVVIAKGLAKEPDQRYGTAGELVDAALASVNGRNEAELAGSGREGMSVDGRSDTTGVSTPDSAPTVIAPGVPGVQSTTGLPPEVAEPTMIGAPAAWSAEPAGGPPAYGPPGAYGYASPVPGYGAYPPPRRRTADQWQWAAFAVACVAVVAAIALAIWFFGIRKDSSSGAAPSTTVTTVTQSQSQVTQQALMAPPNGAAPCNVASGYLQRSAAGSPVTSCEFAEAVRMAYAASGAPSTRTLYNVYSPVTYTAYTMNCVLSQQYVTCTGGNSAVVYIY